MEMRFRWFAASLLPLVLFTAAATAQVKAPVSKLETSCDPATPRLMILGTFHMGNPGQDKYNMEVDDVLAPKRQQEIAALLDKLAAYQPTKIAVEGDFKTQASEKNYERFLAGDYKLGRNEIEQVGMALAKRLGHKHIYPVDYPMWMDGRVPQEIGTAKPRAEEAHGESSAKADANAAAKKKEEPPPDMPAIYRESLERQKTESVLDYLRFLNSDRYTRADHANYMGLLKPDPTSDALYGKTDSLTNWYKRNFRIFTNINRVAEANDRILLLIGAGHQTILRQLAADSPDTCLVDTEEVLK